MAGLGAAAGDDRTTALSTALDGRRPGQSARRARDEPRRHRLSDPPAQCAPDDRTGGVVRLLPAGQRRCHRSLLARVDRNQGPGAASIALPKIMVVSVMEFSERPPRGGLSLSW